MYFCWVYSTVPGLYMIHSETHIVLSKCKLSVLLSTHGPGRLDSSMTVGARAHARPSWSLHTRSMPHLRKLLCSCSHGVQLTCAHQSNVSSADRAEQTIFFSMKDLWKFVLYSCLCFYHYVLGAWVALSGISSMGLTEKGALEEDSGTPGNPGHCSLPPYFFYSSWMVITLTLVVTWVIPTFTVLQ